jgi:hypothetical protein
MNVSLLDQNHLKWFPCSIICALNNTVVTDLEEADAIGKVLRPDLEETLPFAHSPSVYVAAYALLFTNLKTVSSASL